jgi:hypothetical protein
MWNCYQNFRKKYVFEQRKGVESIKGVKFITIFGTRIVGLPILIIENRLPILTTKTSLLKKTSEITLSKVITKILPTQNLLSKILSYF